MMKESHRSESEGPQPVNCMSIACLSELPDSVLQHILSLLPVKDAIKTSILSKRWRPVWAEVPVLSFFAGIHDDFFDQSDARGWQFYRFVDQTLANYRGKKVEKLKINCTYFDCFSSWVDEWIRFATERNVEDLCLYFHSASPTISDYYQLPQSIYSNSSLRMLKISLCDFKASGYVSWTSLKALHIHLSLIDNDGIERILLGSPKLEYLELFTCFGRLDKIAVSPSNLNLTHVFINPFFLLGDLEISGPNIRSLNISTYMEKLQIKLGNLSSLEECILKVRGRRVDKSLVVLLEKLHQVHKLTIDTEFFTIDTEFCDVLLKCKPFKCRSLTVCTNVDEWDFQGIVTLLRSSPHLEELTINMLTTWRKFDDDTKYWESTKTDFRFDHLKVVKIDTLSVRRGMDIQNSLFQMRGFRLRFLTSMLELLLKNAMALEDLVIYTGSEEDKEEVVRLTKSSFSSRSSVNFDVIVRLNSTCKEIVKRFHIEPAHL